MSLHDSYAVVSRSLGRFFEDGAFQLSAAIAYYSLLSIAPLFLIVVAVAGVFFADGQVHMQLIEQMRGLIGDAGATLTQTVIEHTESEERSKWSLLIGTVLTIAGATTVFAQLQSALNRVWRVEAAPGHALFGFIKQRLLSFALVLSIGFLLMVSLVTSALLAMFRAYLDSKIDNLGWVWQGMDLAISFALMTALIALMFKYLPDREIEWRDTWLGAVITAALFIVGKQVIGLYLGQTSVASSFGAAGSVVVFMIWVYYAAAILLFGAEITQAVAEQRGARAPPSEHARPAPNAPERNARAT